LNDVNESALAFSGVNKTDVVNKPFWEGPWWAHSADLRSRLREFVKRAAQGEFIRDEVTHPARDGSLHNIDFTLTPLKNDAGEVTLLIAEGRDITDFTRTKEVLKEAERRATQIIDLLPTPLSSLIGKGASLPGTRPSRSSRALRRPTSSARGTTNTPFRFTEPEGRFSLT